MSRTRLPLIACALLAACAVVPAPADIVLTGGVIWTGDRARPTAEAIAIRTGRIVHVGTDTEVRRFVGPGTVERDLHGSFVVPGFIDTHTHFMAGGFQLASVDLRDASTPDEFVRRIRSYARRIPAGRWITGGDWDHERWPGAPLPTRAWIDSVAPEHPVFVTRTDGHMGVANTLALELARITDATQSPAGGEIVRGRDGRITGVLKDEAMSLIWAAIPPTTTQERDEAFRRAQSHALAHGVTAIHDMGSWEDLETYRRVHAAGEQRIRIYGFVPLASWERMRDFVAREGRGDPRLRWGGLKGFVDGSLGSTTAWFHAPYTDAPSTSGLVTTDTLELARWIAEADAADFQLAIHAIGDRANDWLLGTFESAVERNGPRDRRLRIEHAQHLSRDAIPRFGRAGVIASMQPYHAIDDGRWAEKRIGPERILTTYPFRALLDAGARLAFGSDWTVAPIDPLLGIYAAATRRTLDGRHADGWVPDQKIAVEEALRAYTAGAAFAGFSDAELGRLTGGRRADLVVLSDNLLTIDPVRIPAVEVRLTMIAGVVVYESGGRISRSNATRQAYGPAADDSPDRP